MKERGSWFSPDLCTYNSLIHVLCLLGKVNDAIVVWEELKGSSGLEPDAYTYRIVIQGCSKAYRINDAIKVFSEMQYNDIRPDTIVYNSLLDGLLKERKLTDACNLFQKMIEDDGIRASCWTYNILIDGLFKNGRALVAYTLFCDLKKKSNNFVDGGEAHWDYTERLMKHIRDSNLVPIIIRWKDKDAEIHYQESDPWSSSPYMDMLANKVSSQSNATRKFSLTGGRRIDTKGADSFDIDMEMDEKVCPSDVATYNIIIQGLGKMGRDDLAGAVLDKLMKQGGYLDIVMYNTLINALGKAGRIEEVNKLFQQMKDSGINPDVVTYNTLIEVHAKAGQLKQSYKFFRMMLEAGGVSSGSKHGNQVMILLNWLFEDEISFQALANDLEVILSRKEDRYIYLCWCTLSRSLIEFEGFDVDTMYF
ncbi:hypothetical protein K7X08_021667 [Anisodus acutangulus]|uniref:Pentatricopeptide repeat-containing protein n=1 Tax=Anisodus acutangulus TaxID=402998 RepID=A0A9Q1M9K3_9SOLA|nr:hypothetical protein K7X08_021667 [Anisodus acutangulus]